MALIERFNLPGGRRVRTVDGVPQEMPMSQFRDWMADAGVDVDAAEDVKQYADVQAKVDVRFGENTDGHDVVWVTFTNQSTSKTVLKRRVGPRAGGVTLKPLESTEREYRCKEGWVVSIRTADGELLYEAVRPAD